MAGLRRGSIGRTECSGHSNEYAAGKRSAAQCRKNRSEIANFVKRLNCFLFISCGYQSERLVAVAYDAGRSSGAYDSGSGDNIAVLRIRLSETKRL